MVGAAPLPRTPAPGGVASLSRSHPGSMPTAIAAAGAEPQVFGRYTVIDRLGEGGMCELFIVGMAGPEGFQRTLVLKRLKPEIARTRAAVDQFIDEAKLGSTLIHNNIVPIYDFGHVPDGYYIAEEYVVGRDVGQILQRHLERVGQPLEMRLVFYIAHEALAGLAYAHDRANEAGDPMNIVHRDVSPGNILVSALGEVKLIDFGIAKAEGRVSHTDLGNVKGNAAFMAPEQARGLTIDRRTDLFSLGLVMYYALTGEPLYKGSSTAEVFYAAASGPSAERLARLGKLPPVVAQVLGRALAPDPVDRYANAEEFAADLVDHITPGTRTSMATLLNALFGPELRPLSGGTGSGGSGTSAVRRKLA
jgi:serine/threonine protein kinase